MDDNELAARRQQMGQALAAWSRIPGSVLEVGDGTWLCLSGLPSADANMALVHGSDPREFEHVVATVAAVGAPTLLMSAGEGSALAQGLGQGWSHVGSMPFMMADVASVPTQPDGRVRRATSGDSEVVVGLMCDAFGLPADIARPVVEATLSAGEQMCAWLLEDGGDAVSTVVTSRVGDAVTIWSMSTPERFGRRGFGRALLADVLARAADDGAEVGLLGASPAGQPLYEATGWRPLENWEIFVNGESAQFH